MEKVTCPLCQRELTKQGFGGHMWGTHGVKIGEHAKLEDVGRRVVKLEDDLTARIAELREDLPADRQRLVRLESQVADLRKIHTRDVEGGLDGGKHTAAYG